jgi:hypothetical protein
MAALLVLKQWHGLVVAGQLLLGLFVPQLLGFLKELREAVAIPAVKLVLVAELRAVPSLSFLSPGIYVLSFQFPMLSL